jgi:hypothetical protein
MFNEDNDLSEQERTMLAALPREMAPSDLLEERVVRALKSRGHLGTTSKPNRPWARMALRAAAAILLFVGGAVTGKYMLAQPSAAAAVSTAQVKQTNTEQTEQPSVNKGAQQVKNNETVVAEREMWL